MALSRRKSLNVHIKPDSTLVTNIDKQIEEFLTNRILHYYPDHCILAEEGSSNNRISEFLWVIDPIDGTRSFASGLPIWGISVGILHRNKSVAGVFYMPETREMYWATEKDGFYHDGPIVPRLTVDLYNPLAFIAVPSNAHLNYDISFPRLRSLGSTTAHLAYVARGAAMAALTRNIRIWDIAAVLPLLKVASIGLAYLSGRVFNLQTLLNGSPAPEPLIAAPATLLEEVRTLIKTKPNQ